jgi:hypothetical protein
LLQGDNRFVLLASRLRSADGAIHVPAKFNPSSSGVWPAGGGRAPKASDRRGNVLRAEAQSGPLFAQKRNHLSAGDCATQSKSSFLFLNLCNFFAILL